MGYLLLWLILLAVSPGLAIGLVVVLLAWNVLVRIFLWIFLSSSK